MQWRIVPIFLAVLAWIFCVSTPSWAKKVRSTKSYPIIRDIVIQPKNVFDPAIPGEDYWPYRWANAIRFTTRASVVRQALVVKSGDPADKERLEESERILRALPFIKDVRIQTVPVENGQVDLIVETHDTWTTQPQVSFGSEGEQSHFSLGMVEQNVLGYGKSASYFYNDDPDGVSREYGYDDPQLFGTRVKLSSLFEDTSTGDEQHVTITQPFYSLLTPMAGGATWNHVRGLQKVSDSGVETNRYDLDHHDADAFIGMRVNHNPFSVHRLSLHYKYFTDFVTAVPTTVISTLPENKTFSGPELRWDWIQSDFIKETFIDKAERVEDINLGHQTEISGGYSARLFGSTDNIVPMTFSDSFGFGKEGDAFALTSYGMTGRYNVYSSGQPGGTLSNTLYFLNANYYKHLPTEFPCTGVVHFETAYAQNVDVENQLQLGGDTGLRGFKVDAFTGNKSALMNVEGRAYYPHEILHIAYLGGAAFVDAGQVQPRGMPFSAKDVHASVGLGIRVALTRSTVGSVYRFDVAYAIGPIQQDKRIVFSVASGQGFHRAANTYAKFPGLPITQD